MPTLWQKSLIVRLKAKLKALQGEVEASRSQKAG